MPVALPLLEIGTLLLVLWCIAAALLMVSIIKAVADGFSVLPFPLNKLGGIVSWAAQAIINVLGKAEGGVDAAIGASWHALAWFAREWWHHFTESALFYVGVAELLARLAYAHSGLKAVVHRIERALHGIEHGVRTFERRWQGIEAKVKQLERDLTKGIGHDLRIGLRDLQKEVHGVEHTVTDTLPREIDYVDGKIASLGQFIGAIPGVNYLDWVKGLAIAGLAAVGLAGLRCDNNPLKNKDCNSNVWGELESLLGLATTVLVAADFEQLVREMQGLTEGAVATFKDAAGIG